MKIIVTIFFVFTTLAGFNQTCSELVEQAINTHESFLKGATNEITKLNDINKKLQTCRNKLSKKESYLIKYHLYDCYFYTYTKQYKIDSSIKYGIKTLNYSDSIGGAKHQSSSRAYYALFYYNIHQYDSAIYYYKEALSFALKDTIKTSPCLAYYGLASSYFRIGDDSLSLHYNKLALSLSDSIDNPLQHSRILMQNGVLFISTGELVKGLQFLNRSRTTIEVFKEQYTSQYLAVTMQLVNAYIEIKFYDKANELINESDKYAQNSEYYKGCFLMNKGIISYSGYNKINEAKYLLNEAIEVFKENPAFTDISTCYFYLGTINTEEKNYAFAEKNLLKAIDIEEQGNSYNLSSSYRSLAYIYYLKNDLALAKSWLEKSLNNQPSNYTLKDIYDLYAKILSEEKNYKEALIFKNKYDSLYNMIKGESVRKEINQLIYINDQLLLEKEKEKILIKNKAEKKQLYLTISLLLIGFILALTFVLVLYQRNKFNKQRAYLSAKDIEIKKLKIEVKNKKLDELKESIASQNELIESLKKGSSKELPKETIDDLIKNTASGENWMKFMVEFNKLQEGYLDRLKSSYPELTKNDLRFMALAKLNLGDSEIAKLINVEYESVRKIKYRIKNKLNIDNFDDLLII